MGCMPRMSERLSAWRTIAVVINRSGCSRRPIIIVRIQQFYASSCPRALLCFFFAYLFFLFSLTPHTWCALNEKSPSPSLRIAVPWRTDLMRRFWLKLMHPRPIRRRVQNCCDKDAYYYPLRRSDWLSFVDKSTELTVSWVKVRTNILVCGKHCLRLNSLSSEAVTLSLCKVQTECSLHFSTYSRMPADCWQFRCKMCCSH